MKPFTNTDQNEERQEAERVENLSEGEYYVEAVQQYTAAFGMDRPDDEWILSPFDSWERNPHYTGEPGRHPEDQADQAGH